MRGWLVPVRIGFITMSVGYLYRNDVNCLFLRYEGELTPSDFAAVIDHALADPAIPSEHLRFSDLRSVTAGPDTAALQKMAKVGDAAEERKIALRHAILVGGEAEFGLARLYHAHREQGPDVMNVFREYEAALIWLGLPSDLPDPFSEGRWQPDWSNAG